MTEDFDPYYKWLGIRPEHQPPHHYRLLGLEPLEPHVEVIDAAANRQMSYLREKATGAYVQESQQLLNEVAQARRTLLDPAIKSEYDAALKKQLESQQAQADARKPAGGGLHWVISGVTSIAVLAAAIVFAMSSGSTDSDQAGTLVVDWPLDERQGAQLLIDGVRQELPDERRIEISVPLGQHDVVFQRAGYREIARSSMKFTRDPVKLRFNWIAER